MSLWLKVCMAVVFLVGSAIAEGVTSSAKAMMATQLDFVSGGVNWSGQYGNILDRLFDRAGTIQLGEFQTWSDVIDPISRGRNRFSLLTSGLDGAPVPTATITGNSISVDLSSLFFSWKQGDQFRLLNIGGTATGSFDPLTSEFNLSWDHIFNPGNSQGHRMHDRVATFFLNGTVIGSPAAIPLPASVFLYATGLFGIGSWTWWRRRRMAGAAA